MALAELQKQFGAHLRDPENNPAPSNLDDRRLGIYRELVYINVESLLANNFPVISEILPGPTWHALIREFLRDYRSLTPYFTCLGKEFVEFLVGRGDREDTPDFIVELAHYENLEFDVMLMDDEYPANARPITISEESILTLATTAIPLAYQYPVHRISNDFQPDALTDQLTFLLVFQDGDGEVRFFELQGLSYHLLLLLKENRDTKLKDILVSMADDIRKNDSSFAMSNDVFIDSGLAMLQQFHQLSVLRDSRLLGEAD